MSLYSNLALQIASSIDKGVYTTGDRLPGIRTTSQQEGVSPATVVSAYHYLENEGYIEARPRSGYYVRTRLKSSLQDPKTSRPSKKPQPVTGQSMVMQLIENLSNPELVQFGANVPDLSYLPTHAIERATTKAMRHHKSWPSTYVAPQGLPTLRQQIARRMTTNGCLTDPDHISITSGCQEAVFLTLKSITQPGDIIAVESPTYYGLLQIIDSLGLKALEIPTDPRTGISIDALQLALEQWPIKACVIVPNFSNPLGALMPDENKQDLVALFNQHPDTFLVEDDIYGDLHFEGPRPSLLKTLDTQGNVIHCASFSKTLSPAMRIGWVVNEALIEPLQYQKFVANCATNTLGQLTATELLSSGFYDRHLRTLRTMLNRSMNRVTESVARHFPADVKASQPQGGMSIWIELAKGTDCTKIASAALNQHISIAPGALFASSQSKYQHCMRLNCAIDQSQPVDDVIRTLSSLI